MPHGLITETQAAQRGGGCGCSRVSVIGAAACPFCCGCRAKAHRGNTSRAAWRGGAGVCRWSVFIGAAARPPTGVAVATGAEEPSLSRAFVSAAHASRAAWR